MESLKATADMESTAINLAGGSSCFCFHITARLISQISFSIRPNIVLSQEAVRAHGFVSWVFIINISCMLANTSPVGFHPQQANEEAKEQISPPLEVFFSSSFAPFLIVYNTVVGLGASADSLLASEPRVHRPSASRRIFVNNQ